MDRRGFLGAILAACAAPAIVKAANIMPVFVRKEAGGLLLPETAGSGNTLITIQQITKEALEIFYQNMAAHRKVNAYYAYSFDETCEIF